MKRSCSHIATAGFGQLELMFALALGSGLCLVAAQYYQYAVYVSSVQEHLQQRAERILVLKLTVGSALQQALDKHPMCVAHSDAIATSVTCPDWMQEGASPSIAVDVADASNIASIAPDGDMLSIRGVEAQGITQYFTAHHTTLGHHALYRRRASANGGYQAAEELVTGWSGMQVSACYRDDIMDLARHCVSARNSARPFEVLRICVQHESPPMAVTQLLGAAVSESLPDHTCVISRRL